MTVTAIILAHHMQREVNLPRIVESLKNSSHPLQEIVVFIDNENIKFEDDTVTIIRSSKSFLPRIRFSLATYFTSDYCFFIDDDLAVRKNTVANLVDAAKKIGDDDLILGLQGSILGKTDNPYADDTSIKRGQKLIPVEVDVVLRTYFASKTALVMYNKLLLNHPHLEEISLDDIYLSLGNKYLNGGKNYVVGISESSDVDELNEGGVGQSFTGKHYENRNKTTKYLMDIYDR